HVGLWVGRLAEFLHRWVVASCQDERVAEIERSACVHGLTGGDDPSMEEFGEPTHPQANVIPAERQAFELALVRFARERDLPTLGVCLGMQLMALEAGGTLDQYLPDSLPTHPDHCDDHVHRVIPEDVADNPIGEGEVTSWHRQAITNPGTMRVVARAHDGVIEAIDDPALHYFVGVQWHPERTESSGVGLTIFEQLVAAAYENARHTDQQIG
ncbi:MAG: gamma-glutamyl-gamma-aminobutyrate hydrolase family protein, partial [Planctomycetota bacterium]